MTDSVLLAEEVWNDHVVLPRSVVRWSAAVLTIFALAACTATSPPPPPPEIPTAMPAEPACPESGVTVAEGLNEAVMGLRVLTLDLTNCGTEPVLLNGFPGIHVLGADGAVLGVQVGTGSFGISAVPAFDAPPQPTTVAPGETAITGVMWSSVNTGPTPGVGARLEISPRPGDPWQEVDTVDGDMHIDLGTTGKLGVRPWSVPVPGQ